MLVVSKDIGGGEFFQLYTLANGRLNLLTDGKSRNEFGSWDKEGRLIGYSSTRRNGTDSDLYVVDPRDPGTNRLVAQVKGGGWGITRLRSGRRQGRGDRIYLDHQEQSVPPRRREREADADRQSQEGHRLRQSQVRTGRDPLGDFRRGQRRPAARPPQSRERQIHAGEPKGALGRGRLRDQRGRPHDCLRHQRSGRRQAVPDGCRQRQRTSGVGTSRRLDRQPRVRALGAARLRAHVGEEPVGRLFARPRYPAGHALDGKRDRRARSQQATSSRS